nr:class B sortase [Oscillospiraceae bacterium]
MNMKKVIFLVTIVLLLAAFGVSAFMVGSYLVNGQKQEERNDELAQMVEDARNDAVKATEAVPETTVPTIAEETVATEATEPQILSPYESLYQQNNDMVGWLQIPNTKLKYAVMQTPDDSDYYLDHNFDKQKSDWGAIFAWGAADINKPSDNITLFGHNMKDGSMFATLNNYVHEYYWEDNSIIIFDTLYEYHTYKIFAVFKTNATLGEGFAYHQFVDAENEEEFNEFVATCKELAEYDTGITPKYGDKLISLSTCAYHEANGRLVVCAYRIT